MTPARRRLQWLAFHALVAAWLAWAFWVNPRLASMVRASLPTDSGYYEAAQPEDEP